MTILSVFVFIPFLGLYLGVITIYLDIFLYHALQTTQYPVSMLTLHVKVVTPLQ